MRGADRKTQPELKSAAEETVHSGDGQVSPKARSFREEIKRRLLTSEGIPEVEVEELVEEMKWWSLMASGEEMQGRGRASSTLILSEAWPSWALAPGHSLHSH